MLSPRKWFKFYFARPGDLVRCEEFGDGIVYEIWRYPTYYPLIVKFRYADGGCFSKCYTKSGRLCVREKDDNTQLKWGNSE